MKHIITTLMAVIFTASTYGAVNITSGIDADIYHGAGGPNGMPSSSKDSLFVAEGSHGHTTLLEFETGNTWTGSPAGMTATLRLYAQDAGYNYYTGAPVSNFSAGTVDFAINYSDWSESSLFSTPDLSSFVAGPHWSQSLNVTGQNQWYEVDVTSVVLAYMGGASNNGFILTGSNGVSVNFASFDNGGEYSPELVISGSVVPEPSTYALLLGVFAFAALFIKRKNK